MTNLDDDTRWLHSDTDLLSGHGVNYSVTYLGSVEVLCSMKTLDFDNRTRVARDSIRLVCTAVGVATKERRKPDQSSSITQSMISTEPNLTHSHTAVQLTINTDSLVLKRLNDSHIFFSHKMEGISFASAGEHETKDYIAYVAKDNTNKRSCHVLSCKENESLDVITTIGQAFELRYNEYMQTQQGSVKSFENDEFLQQKRDDDINRSIPSNNQQQQQTQGKWNTMNSPDVYKEKWFHGKIGRDEAELLLHNSGDFLVRESAKIPGQFILSGRHKDQFKHLLLVDPEGIIRTKDYEFDSIQHLISYHKSGNIPIVSADSELLLQTPVLRSK
ncbi:unnamed protein product [Adineta steineri]|uniref:Uncharacterized protein n=1 Tax=Adineta steineri TaxID=433720 RepID=A0A818NPZ3_9BILA|nr:unnamed protein product [Adineta steineri]CAF0980452.1 unnamed protein product [Adineta steineri]CAF1096906.1 unnamed protein product [Adineta steineri]CAF3610295.1 unnamed protein product [Adineta steineri]CAF3676794.1 unnamed protein product [Adineta steineri]